MNRDIIFVNDKNDVTVFLTPEICMIYSEQIYFAYYIVGIENRPQFPKQEES